MNGGLEELVRDVAEGRGRGLRVRNRGSVEAVGEIMRGVEIEPAVNGAKRRLADKLHRDGEEATVTGEAMDALDWVATPKDASAERPLTEIVRTFCRWTFLASPTELVLPKTN